MSPSIDSTDRTPAQSLKPVARPFDKIWRGNKQGTVRLEGVPKFDNPYAEREWIKAHMAAVFRLWGKLGFGEGISGHITVRDPVLPGHYWMNPLAVHFSSVTKSKLVLVTPDGQVSPHGAQLPINAAGFYIREHSKSGLNGVASFFADLTKDSAIHKARPDINAAAHCHSIHGKAWSVFGKPIDTLTQDTCLFYDNHGVYPNFGGVVLAEEEGENIAQALGPKWKTCILQNHGLLTLGNTVDEAAFLFVSLERQCKVQLLVEAASAGGIQRTVVGKEEAEYSAQFIQDSDTTYVSFQPEYNLLVEETNGAFFK